MIEDHTHCVQCRKVCYYPDIPHAASNAHELGLCWECYKKYTPKKKDTFKVYVGDEL